MRLLVGLALFELRDQLFELRIPGIEDEQLASVPERCGKVPLVALDRDERHQDVAIRRMLLVCLFQGGRRLSRLTARIQRHGVDIGVAGIVGSELAGSAKPPDDGSEPESPRQDRPPHMDVET